MRRAISDARYELARNSENRVSLEIGMDIVIKSNNVVLNMAISRGLSLIPSNMVILKEKIPGYNNIMTKAKEYMKFGANRSVSYVGKKLEVKRNHQSDQPSNHLDALRCSPKTKRTTPSILDLEERYCLLTR